jgi:type I restriction enzyme, S subunit
MNVFAWEGAIAVAQPDDDERVGSHRFLTHEINPDLATPEFLCFHFLTPQGLDAIGAASPGSAGRNRTLGIDKLAQIEVPVPVIEVQRRFARMSRLQHELRRLRREVESDLAAFVPALLAKAFGGKL